MANPFAVIPSAVSDDSVTRLKHQLKAYKNESEQIVKALKDKSKAIVERFTSEEATLMGLGSSAIGGYSYAWFSEFVLNTLANKDANSVIYRYRILIPALLGMYGDKIVGKDVANSPSFKAVLHGLIGAAMYDYQRAGAFAPKTEKTTEKTPNESPKSSGFDNIGIGAEIAALSGVDDLEMIVDSGAIPARTARKILRLLTEDEQEGKSAALEALESVCDGLDPETGAKSSKAAKVEQEASQAYTKLVRKVGLPPQVKKKDEAYARLKAENRRLKARLDSSNQNANEPAYSEPSEYAEQFEE